jgi:RimJ/RimL family protein N-acetyltransferase
MINNHNVSRLDTLNLLLEWIEATWDSVVFGCPVLQIIRMEVRSPLAGIDFAVFEELRERMKAGMVSCRMPHAALKDSMLLEEHGFRFIEMVYLPELNDLSEYAKADEPPDLLVRRAREADLPVLMDIAGSAFRNERFHVDPRLDATLADKRYRNWVKSSHNHASQRLYSIHDGSRLVSFFVTEMMPDGTYYWHLNAVAPEAQGQGYGRRAWQAMLRQAREAGAQRVRTSIVARNHRVLNLYARLGFRFSPPLMTFHWVREQQA